MDVDSFALFAAIAPAMTFKSPVPSWKLLPPKVILPPPLDWLPAKAPMATLLPLALALFTTWWLLVAAPAPRPSVILPSLVNVVPTAPTLPLFSTMFIGATGAADTIPIDNAENTIPVNTKCFLLIAIHSFAYYDFTKLSYNLQIHNNT